MKTEYESADITGKPYQGPRSPLQGQSTAVHVVTHPDLALGSLLHSLRKIFGNNTIQPVPLSTITPRLLRPANLLVLPGCLGEKSPYTPEATRTLARALPEFIERGGHVLGICAGGYHGLERSIYQPPQRPHKEIRREGLSLMFGRAVGPLESYYLESGDNDRPTAGPHLVPITYTDADGRERTAAMPYHNGPWFEPEENVDVIARYAETRKLAAVRKWGGQKWTGQGSVTLTGILAEIDPRTTPLPGLNPVDRDHLFRQLLAPALGE